MLDLMKTWWSRLGFIGQLAVCSLYLVLRYFVLISLNKAQLLFLISTKHTYKRGEKTSEMANVINDSAVRVWPDTGTPQVDCLKNSRFKGKQHSLKRYSDGLRPCEPPQTPQSLWIHFHGEQYEAGSEGQ